MKSNFHTPWEEPPRSAGTITIYDGRNLVLIDDDKAHDAEHIREVAAKGFNYWGWSDTWKRKSEGGYSFYFMCRSREDCKSIGVNTHVFKVEDAIRDWTDAKGK